jgi:putative redox protein
MTITVKRNANRIGLHGTVEIRNHGISIDASTAAGGDDAGPEPHDLYDAALGACKTLTVLVYAKRKGIPVDDIEVTIDRDDSGERHGVYKLKASLRVTGDLSDGQRDELMRVASKCPVHKLMTEVKTEIETVWSA